MFFAFQSNLKADYWKQVPPDWKVIKMCFVKDFVRKHRSALKASKRSASFKSSTLSLNALGGVSENFQWPTRNALLAAVPKNPKKRQDIAAGSIKSFKADNLKNMPISILWPGRAFENCWSLSSRHSPSVATAFCGWSAETSTGPP